MAKLGFSELTTNFPIGFDKLISIWRDNQNGDSFADNINVNYHLFTGLNQNEIQSPIIQAYDGTRTGRQLIDELQFATISTEKPRSDSNFLRVVADIKLSTPSQNFQLTIGEFVPIEGTVRHYTFDGEGKFAEAKVRFNFDGSVNSFFIREFNGQSYLFEGNLTVEIIEKEWRS